MRKLLSLACLAFALASCGGEGGASSTETALPSSADITWTITFEVNGGSPVDPIKVKHGEKASAPGTSPDTGYGSSSLVHEKIAAAAAAAIIIILAIFIIS